MIKSDPVASAKLRAELDKLTRGDVSKADKAEWHLHAAATDYVDSQPLVDANGRRSRTSISTARSSVADLAKYLAAAIAAARDLPVDAKSAVVDAFDAPVGALIQDLVRMDKGVNVALDFLNGQPNKTRDHHRAVLAFDVARVFRDDLGLKPAATRDTADITGVRDGGAYARVLRATFELAGVPQIDIGPVIDRGLDLLDDPDIPPDLKL